MTRSTCLCVALVTLAAVAAGCARVQHEVTVVPTPRHMSVGVGAGFSLGSGLPVLLGKVVAGAAWCVEPLLKEPAHGASILGPLSAEAEKLPAVCALIGTPADHPELEALHRDLAPRLPPGGLGSEGYVLRTSPRGLRIVAATPAGAFYGVQTFLQLVREGAVPPVSIADAPAKPFRGIHIGGGRPADLALIKRLISEEMPRQKANVLVYAVGYRFEFKSHPEVKEDTMITAEQARELARLARRNNVRLIPLVNCFGHQSWLMGRIHGLLRAYPELNETPGKQSKYCYSWCPLHPKVYEIVLPLLDEIIDAFEADAVHLGLDEVLELGECERCKGKSNAELFATGVNRLYDHVVGKRKVQMLMWGDRLVDGEKTPYNPMNGSRNGTHPAIEKVAKDIFICDWHYHLHETYPSVDQFKSAGFDFVSCSWWKPEPVDAFIRYATKHGGDRYKGHLATNWNPPYYVLGAMFGQEPEGAKPADYAEYKHREAVAAFRRGMELSWHGATE